ncbi:MAG TPA: universal stress protein [Longimicrobiaceae bacterium]|nr:universal stress protein [Longimicrobiaceae bacterium]
MPLPIRSVLIASDLSESSDEVLRAAAEIASLSGAVLHVIHVLEPPPLHLPGAADGALDVEARLQTARLALAEQLRRTATRQAAKSAHTALDAPHRAIRERAREVGADLIVIGANRGRDLGDHLLGTTADRLVRTSEAPCLIVRGPVPLPLRRVLVPTDLSRHSELALAEAFTWATALGLPPTAEDGEPTEVLAFHVIPLLGAIDLAAPNREWVAARLRDQVATARAGVPAAVRLRARVEVTQHTSPAAEILRRAGSGTDLLVLGTHGRSALGRTLIGSVASEVARRAECPVLLVPPVFEVAYPRAPAAAGSTGGGDEPEPRPAASLLE